MTCVLQGQVRQRRRLHVLHGRRVQARRGVAAGREIRRLAAVDGNRVAAFKQMSGPRSRRRSCASRCPRAASRARRRSSASPPIRRSKRTNSRGSRRRPTCWRSRCATSCAKSWARPTASRWVWRSRCRSAAPAASASASVARPTRSTAMVERTLKEVRACSRKGRSEDLTNRAKETARRAHETAKRQNGFWLGRLQSAKLLGRDPNLILTREQRIDADQPREHPRDVQEVLPDGPLHRRHAGARSSKVLRAQVLRCNLIVLRATVRRPAPDRRDPHMQHVALSVAEHVRT